MKKKLAFSIAGAAATVIGGWKLVQQLVDRGEGQAPAATDSPAPAPHSASPEEAGQPSATVPDGSSSKAELYRVATKLGIKGRSKMSKDELLKAIREAS